MNDIKTQTHKYAFVMLCMKGDAYAPGVIVMAESIRLVSKLDIVCMCTPDVSARARAAISTVARVHSIEYITRATKSMKTSRQMELYGSWLCESYTKWRCLELNYEKVLFVDADMIVVQSIDHLFELAAPAGTFSSPWAREYTASSGFDLSGYPREHAATVAASSILDTIRRGNGYLVIASMVLLEPSKKDFDALVAMVTDMQPFGIDSWSTPDEQSIALYYATAGRDWTHIHQCYNFIITKPQWIMRKTATGTVCTVPHVLHYFADKKPWGMTHSFRASPFATDAVWWYILRRWWLRTGIELPLARFDEMKSAEKITLENSPMLRKRFPWLGTLKVPFPDLF